MGCDRIILERKETDEGLLLFVDLMHQSNASKPHTVGAMTLKILKSIE